MSIRTIRNAAGRVVGHQAFAGSGGPGLTTYVPASCQDAKAVLAAAELALAGIHRAANPKPPRDPLTGLRMVLQRGRHEDSVPVMYVDAVWREKGRNVHRCYSTERHGRIGALRMAMSEIWRNTGAAVGIPPSAALAELMVRFDKKHSPNQNDPTERSAS